MHSWPAYTPSVRAAGGTDLPGAFRSPRGPGSLGRDSRAGTPRARPAWQAARAVPNLPEGCGLAGRGQQGRSGGGATAAGLACLDPARADPRPRRGDPRDQGKLGGGARRAAGAALPTPRGLAAPPSGSLVPAACARAGAQPGAGARAGAGAGRPPHTLRSAARVSAAGCLPQRSKPRGRHPGEGVGVHVAGGV